MPNNRPQGRKTSVSGKSTGVYRRGEGQGTGPVGSANSHPQRRPSSSGGVSRAARAGSGGGLLLILLVVAYFIFSKGRSGRPAGRLRQRRLHLRGGSGQPAESGRRFLCRQL